MESRLPQPKVTLSNTISKIDISTKMNNQKVTKNGTEVPQASSNGIKDKLTKAKSTLNIAAKCTNENKLLPKQTLARSKTMVSFSSTAKAVKRPAAPTVHGEVKKLFTRPTMKPLTTQKTGVNLNVNATNKSLQSTAAKKAQTTVAAKPSKWDIKGQLAHKTEELSNLKQKHKDTTAKYNELNEQIEALKANEGAYKTKAEEFEISNKTLSQKLNELEEKMCKVQEEREDLSRRLKESEESHRNVSDMLKICKEKCISNETLLSTKAAEVQDLKTDLETQKNINKELSTMRDDLQALVHTMDKDRRALHNAIQELKGNIRVFCRVRPRTPCESAKPLCAMNFLDECTIEVGKSDGSNAVSCSGKLRGTKQEFSFDKVFPPNTRQEDVFDELSLLVQSALEGYNVCVFAYGQTGSGKTYTMEGIPGSETEGMIPRTVRHIFQEMKQFQLLGWEYSIEASFLEIYNEHIVDLLDAQPKSHEIRMADSKGSDLYVTNLKIEEIHSPEELHECLLTAQRNRAVAATQSNERSSRSHSVARIRLIGTHTKKNEFSIGNLNLVDLAGSERLKGEEMARVTETKNINKSLANLGNVILALLKKQEHVPYRNSKLTHLLMPSLGGNSKTLMLLNISPLDECYNETLNSLRFASSVNSCKTGNVKRTRAIIQNNS